MKTFPFPHERVLFARLERGDDLLAALTSLRAAGGVTAATIEGIQDGALFVHAHLTSPTARAGRRRPRG
ncbi:MAG: hypothetical protein ABIO70_21495 [Pseudomonadota bacterium]